MPSARRVLFRRMLWHFELLNPDCEHRLDSFRSCLAIVGLTSVRRRCSAGRKRASGSCQTWRAAEYLLSQVRNLGKFRIMCGSNAQVADDLSPIRVLALFSAVDGNDLELLDLACRPEHLLMSHLPVPPVCIRPSVEMDTGAGSNEDDITMKLMARPSERSAVRFSMETTAPGVHPAQHGAGQQRRQR